MHRDGAAGLAARGREAGVTFRYGAPVDRILLRDGDESARCAGVRLAGGERRRGRRRRRATPTCPVAYRTLLPGARRRRVRPPRALLAVVPWCGTPACGALRRAGAAHHNIHFGARVGRRLPRAPRTTASPHARSVDPRHACRRSTTPALAPAGLLRRSTCSSRCPTSTGASTGPASGTACATTCSRTGRRARLPDRRRGRAARRPDSTGRPGHGAGHAVRAWPHTLLPDRPVPARATSTGACRGWCSSGSGTVPGVGVPMVLVSGRWPPQRVERTGAAGGRGSDGRDGDRVTLEAVLRAAAAQLNKRHGTTYYWSTHAAAPRRSATTCTRSTASAATPTTSSTTSAPAPSPTSERGRCADFGDRFFADLAAGRVRRPGAQGGRPHRARLRPSTRTASVASCARWRWTSPSTAYETWDDLLVYMDGSAAVIGEMMLPILEPSIRAAARHRARDLGRRLPAHQLPARRRRGPRPRPRRTCRRRTCAASAPTLRRARATPELVEPHALRDRPLPRRCTGRPTSASPCCRPRRPAASRAARLLYCRILDAHRGARTTTCSPGGRGCRPGRRRRWWRGRSVAERSAVPDGRRRGGGRSPRVGDGGHARSPAGGATGGGRSRRWSSGLGRDEHRCRRRRRWGRAPGALAAAAVLPATALVEAAGTATGCPSGATATPARSARRSAGCRSSSRWRGWRWRCRAVRPPTRHWDGVDTVATRRCSAPRRWPRGTSSSIRRWSARATGAGPPAGATAASRSPTSSAGLRRAWRVMGVLEALLPIEADEAPTGARRRSTAAWPRWRPSASPPSSATRWSPLAGALAMLPIAGAAAARVLGGGPVAEVVVVGGGVGGLAAAIRLPRRRPRRASCSNATSTRAASSPCSRATASPSTLGPSLLTLPHVFDEVLRVAGARLDDEVDAGAARPPVPLPLDRRHRRRRPRPRGDRRGVERWSPGSGAAWRRFDERAGGSGRSASARSSPARWTAWRRCAGSVRRATSSRSTRCARWRARPPRRSTIRACGSGLGRYATYSGSFAHRAPATLACIPAIERGTACWYPMAGWARCADARARGERGDGRRVAEPPPTWRGSRRPATR